MPTFPLDKTGTLWGAEFVDSLGRWALKYLNAVVFSLVCAALLIIWVVLCFIKKRQPSNVAARAIVLGVLELYLAVTVWAVFITWPPATHLLARELLMAVGLVSAVALIGSGAPRIYAAFAGNGAAKANRSAAGAEKQEDKEKPAD